MVRGVVVAVASVLLGCKDKPASVPVGSGSGAGSSTVMDAAVASSLDATDTDAASKPAWRDLLRAVPSTIRVSSKVANKTIEPRHIIDGDLNTAWNSVTGELVGAWVDVTLPDAVTIGELRLTVGHTGKGPKGEDYFAMNHRITKVSVLRGDQLLGTFTLDPARRDLQTIPLATTGGTLRIRVDGVVPGTKPHWREAAISELEIWGDPPPGWTPPATAIVPTVELQPPPVPTDLKSACADYQPDECSLEIDETVLAPPFRGAAVRCTPAEHYGSICAIVIAVDGELLETASVYTGGPHDSMSKLSIHELEVKDVLPPRPPELVMRYGGDRTTWMIVVRAKPTVAYSQPIAVGGAVLAEADPDSPGPPGPQPTGEEWSVDVQFANGAAILRKRSGEVPSDVLGKKPLVF